MAELKTQKNTASVEAFLKGVADPRQREDAILVTEMMRKITGAPPAMWGESIVGFGHYVCKYPSGRELDWFVTGFSPRKDKLTLYLMGGLERQGTLLKRLGKHKIGKSCLYIKRLDDVDLPTLRELVKRSVQSVTKGKKKTKAT